MIQNPEYLGSMAVIRVYNRYSKVVSSCLIACIYLIACLPDDVWKMKKSARSLSTNTGH